MRVTIDFTAGSARSCPRSVDSIAEPTITTAASPRRVKRATKAANKSRRCLSKREGGTIGMSGIAGSGGPRAGGRLVDGFAIAVGWNDDLADRLPSLESLQHARLSQALVCKQLTHECDEGFSRRRRFWERLYSEAKVSPQRLATRVAIVWL